METADGLRGKLGEAEANLVREKRRAELAEVGFFSLPSVHLLRGGHSHV